MPSASTPVRNALAYAAPELFWGLAWGATLEGPLVAAFSKGFHGSDTFVGLVFLLTALGLGLPMFFTAYWVESLRHKRAWVFWWHVAGGLVMLATALLLHLAGEGDPALVRGAYLLGLTLFFLTIGILVPGWLALVGELFPAHQRSRVLGLTFLVNRIGAFFGGRVAFLVLDAPWSALDQWVFLFSMAGAAGIVGSLAYYWIVETPRERPVRMRPLAYMKSLGAALRELPGLRRFIATDLLGITTMVTVSFYARAALLRDGFHESRAGLWVMCGAMAQMAMSACVALVGGRVRPRTWMAVGLAAAALGAGFAAVGGSFVVYAVTASALGIWLACRNSCHGPQVMRLAPGRDGTAPIGIAIGLAMPVGGLAPFAAGLVIPKSGYLPVFCVVGALACLSALLLLRWVPHGTGNEVPGPSPRGPAV